MCINLVEWCESYRQLAVFPSVLAKERYFPGCRTHQELLSGWFGRTEPLNLFYPLFRHCSSSI